MCGVAGWLGFIPDGPRWAETLVAALRHRGPDSYGIEAWEEATLVHTRLSIIDLSSTGRQPMCNEDGTVWTAFNGEIYNHCEIRRKLESLGHVFRGCSDTEVLPHLYEEYGTALFEHLRGMFTVAIYDVTKRRLLLARDRFGVKPLFYSITSYHLAFASELRALLQLPGIDKQPNRQAVFDFAALFFIPAPETFYRGVQSLQPGEFLEAHFDGKHISWRTNFYYRWTLAPDYSISFHDAVERVNVLIEAAVRRQLESDVPLGALLSGGIDSSLVSSAAQAALEHKLRTFNVKFEDEAYDETWAAVAVADHIGSDHEVLRMTYEGGTWEEVAKLLTHCGQPFADTSLFAASAVCGLMRQYVTVALSGDGGDEGFGGYNLYKTIDWISRWRMLPKNVARFGARALQFGGFGIARSGFLQRVSEIDGADDVSTIQTLSCWIRNAEHRALCVDDHLLPVRRFFEPQWERQGHLPASERERLSILATEVGIRLTLPNDFLFKIDTASMRASLEVRVPMLDEDLFDFALTLPHRLKTAKGVSKIVLRGAAERKLPRSVAVKPKKGFEIPVDKWVDEDFRIRLKDKLLGSTCRLEEFFRPEAYRPVIEAFCNGLPCPGISRAGLYQRIIMLLSVQLALEPERRT